MREAEFQAFHTGAYARLVGVLTAMTGDPVAAEAAVGEAFARAWARRRRLGRDVSAEAWVRMTALRLARRSARGRSPARPAAVGAAATPVLELLDPLSPRPRAALVLRHLCDLVPAEVAEELRARPGAVAGWLAADPVTEEMWQGWRPPAVAPPPFATVRRRGTRLRHRAGWLRAVTAAAAFTAVTAPAVASGWSPADLRGGPGPGPRLQLVPGPDHGRLSRILADFPLTAGLSVSPSETVVGPAKDLQMFVGREACGHPYAILGQIADRLSVAVVDDNLGPVAQRVLVVASELDLADADLAAQGILERFVAPFWGCHADVAADGRSVQTTVRRSRLGDEGWTVLRVRPAGGSGASEQEILQVVRVGRAVLITQSTDQGRTVVSRSDLVAAVAADVDATAPVVAAMCAWDDQGCR